MQTTNGLSENFNSRYFEAMRRAGVVGLAGRTAIRGYQYEELSNYEQRQYDEISSAFVEALAGRVNTHYAFDLKNGHLVAKDGEDIGQLMQRGLEDAYAMAEEDDFFASFVPQRAQAELAEHQENQKMALGQTDYNTIITFSPHTEELFSTDNMEKLKKAGQKPQYKRSMLRISHWDGQQLHMFTRSIDNSNLELLRTTAKKTLAYEFKANNSTQMLAERIHGNISDSSWVDLADRIVYEADEIMAATRGGKWQQGRSEADAVNLQSYISRNKEIVLELMAVGRRLAQEHSSYQSYKKAFEAEFYNYLALMDMRLENKAESCLSDIQASAAAAGALAEAEGRSYDACGMIIGPEGDSEGVAQATGFESLLRLEGKKVTCPECKSKVVVPKDELKAGRLSCSDCGYGIDICTGQKFKKPKQKKVERTEPDFFEELGNKLREYGARDRQKSKQKQQAEQAKKQGITTLSLW